MTDGMYSEYEQGFMQGVNNNPPECPYSPMSYEYERWQQGYARGFADYR